MIDPIRVTRNQLRNIIENDDDAIRNFERVFEAVDALVQAEVDARITDLEARVTALETP